MTRMYPGSGQDFECIKGKPWATGKAELRASLVGGLVLDKADAVITAVMPHPIVNDIRQAVLAAGDTTCTGCARTRAKTVLGNKVKALDEQTRKSVYDVIGLAA